MTDIKKLTFGASVNTKEEDGKKIMIIDYSYSSRRDLQRSLDMLSLSKAFMNSEIDCDTLIMREFGFEIELKNKSHGRYK